MRQVCTVPLSIAVALAAILLTAAVVVPRLDAESPPPRRRRSQPRSVIFPPSVRAGDSLRVLVDAPNSSTCDGSITTGTTPSRPSARSGESDGRCRWDVRGAGHHPTRRGRHLRHRPQRQGADDADRHLRRGAPLRRRRPGARELPGEVKRNNKFSVRIDVPDKATCQGSITYEDGKTQVLDPKTEDNEQCRWDLTVPPDVDRGEARLKRDVTQDGRASTLLTSFDVARGNNDPDILVAFQDLVATRSARRRPADPRAGPGGGEVQGRRLLPLSREREARRDPRRGRHSVAGRVTVPDEAKRGDSKVTVTVRTDGADTSITGGRRRSTRPPRTSTPISRICRARSAGATTSRFGSRCRRTPPAGASVALRRRRRSVPSSPQSEKKDRCLWSVRVPAYTPRGKAIVWVLIDDHGVQTTLTGNVRSKGARTSR